MSELKPGDYIAGEYRIRRVFGGHGKSGMGVVYLVEGRSSEEPFVLKTFQTAKVSPQAIGRFKAEAENWVKVGKHPNIVQCFWVRELADQLFIAAEFVWPDQTGRNTLTHYLADGVLPLQQQVTWIAQFCFGMKHAIARGIRAHRDIKPDNLMVDNRGRLKMTDFGLAKGGVVGTDGIGVNAKDTGNSNLTRDGSALGTPPFMSPEQFFDAASVDHRADIYALGVVIYQMISGGQLPIIPPASAEASNPFTHWAIAHMQQRVPRLDSPLMGIAERCLEKKCERRFQSYDEILDTLRRICQKHKLCFPAEGESQGAEFAGEYALAQSLTTLGRPEEAVTKLREMARRWPGASEVFTELGRVYLESGRINEALAATEQSLKIYPSSTAAWNNLGVILCRFQRFADAKQAFGNALAIDPENTGAMMQLAQVHLVEGSKNEAKQLAELAVFWRPEKVSVLQIASECLLRCKETRRANQILEKLVSLKPDDSRAWFNLALCRHDLKDAGGYVRALQEVVKLNPGDGEALNFLVQALVDLGRMDAAISTCEMLEKVKGWEIAGICKHAQLLSATGAGMSAYLLLNKWTSQHERSAALWFTMAVILGQAPEQYRPQALTAAQNALLCHDETPKQLTPENYRVLKELISDLSQP